MTLFAEKVVASRLKQSAPPSLAPLIRNCWYAIAAREEFDRTLKQRWVLGEPVVYYLSTDGSPVVLDDRCAHRRFPLSRSRLEGDEIICGYHGFTYAYNGQCVRIPGGGDPSSVRVRSYPAVQRGPWVWIWTGTQPDKADPSLIPWPADANGEGHIVTGYTFNPANYSMVHENLLDMSHLEFLHGVPDAGIMTVVKPTLLSAEELPTPFADSSSGTLSHFSGPIGMWGVAAGDDPTAAVHRTDYIVSVTPAMNYGVITIEPDGSHGMNVKKVVIAHCLTPADESHTHQFWAYWQDVPFAVDNWTDVAYQLFKQDVEALGWVQEYVERDTREGLVERSAAADAASLKLRRKFQQLVAAESH